MSAEGFRLVIPQEMLNKLDAADKKLQALGNTSKKTGHYVQQSFGKMIDSVQAFINKVGNAQLALHNLGNFKGNNINLGNVSIQATQNVDAINKLIDALVKLKMAKKGSGAKSSSIVAPIPIPNIEGWTKLQQSISQSEQRVKQLTQSTREYEATLKRIQSGKGGVLSKQEQEQYKLNKLEIDELNKSITLQRQKQQEIIAQNNAIQAQLRLREQLRNFEQNKNSLPNQRQNAEMQQLNAYYRELEKTSKKDEERRIKEEQRSARAAEKIAKDEEKKAQAAERAAQRAAKAEERRIAQITRAKERLQPSTISGQRVNYLLDISRNATSINQLLISIKNLEKAKKDLDTTDKNYKKTLAEIDNAINKNKQSLRRLGVETENVRKHQSNLMNHAQQLRRALALVFSVSQIAGYVNKMIQIRGEFELQQRSLQAILQNKDEANKIWQQTVDLAVRSPFRVKELVTYTKQLASYRVETEKLHETTKMLSDVSAGLGVDMQRLILAFGQVKAANYLRGTELRQFSEAGINILGELAKYFTELEGRAVSVGEVFERVSKRMVAFSDVEEIFKRVTSEGGVFYRMQEIQSETVKGLISNLYDQVDLMLNEMGKSNDGYIKGVIGLVKSLVENWKYVAEAIKIAGAAWLVYKVQAQLAHEKNMLLAIDFGILTDASQKQLKFTQLLALSWKRVTLAVKTFTKALIANPIILAITAALYAATKLYSAWSKHQEQLEEITKQYKELRKEVTDISVKFTYASNIEEQKKELSKLIGVAKDKYNLNVDIDVKDLDEQEVSEKFNNLRNEILNTMAFTEQMSKAIVESDAWYKWGDDIYGAFEKFSKSAQEYSNVIRNKKNAIVEFLTETGRFDDVAKEFFAERGEYVKNETELEYIERLTLAYKLYYKEIVRGGKIIGANGLIQRPTEEVEALRKAASEYVKAKEDAVKEFDEFAKDFNIPSILTEENKTAYVKTAIDQQGFDDFTREMWYKLANQRFSVNITPKAVAPTELEDWAVRVTDAIKEVNAKIKKENPNIEDNQLFPLPQIGQTREQYLNLAKARLDIAKSTYNEEQKIIDDSTVKQTEALAPYADAVEKILNLYKTKTAGDGGRDIFADQIRVIKEIYQAYKDLGKTLDDIGAKEGAMQKFGNAFKEAFGKTPEEMGFDLFSEEGVKKAYDYLIKNAPNAKKKIQAELAKGEIVLETKVRLQQEEDKKFADQIADMFSGYELSLELQKLNIPQDLAQQLFGVETFDLSQIREKLEKEIADAEKQGGREDFVAERKKELEKVEEMERKAREERLKTYSKYLVKGMDERVRIKIEELRKLEEVEKDKDVYTPQQRADIRSAIQKEAQEALYKQAWDEFKNTDLYISLFEDLEDASNRSLKIMIERLNSLRESLKDLPPEQLKEIVKQLEKAQDELEGRNPFKKFGNDLKDYFGNIGKRKEAQQGVDYTEKRLTYLRAEAESQRDIIVQYESRQEKGENLTDREKEHLEMIKTALSLTKQQISNTEQAQQSWQKILDSIKKGADGIGEAFENTGEFLQSMGSYVTDMANKWEQAFGLSDEAKDDIETIAGVAQGAGDMAIGIGKAIKDPADIGAYMQAASGLMTVFATFGQAHDKKKERQIEREMKLVERLQKVYEDLGETIQNTYSLDTLNEATQMSRENLMAQINATERMIEAEKDKKDTDWGRIEEWRGQIEEDREAMKELEETRLQELGGFASDENKKSGAQAFVDAWFEAYKQTGDGLTGLNEQFDEFFEDSVKRQMLQKATNKYLDNLFNKYDTAINDWAEGGLTDEELNEKLSGLKNDLPALNESLKKWAEAAGIAVEFAGKDAELSGLQAGIQGITEDQADVLASYWSSVRLYTADTNTKFADLITRLFDSEGSSNPMLAELRAQTAFIQEIRDVLGSVVRGGHSMGGTGLKVFIS